MSILLDSLRKSEAQHKNRAGPTIHSAEAYGGRPGGPARWPVVAMILLAAVAMGWFGWRQYAEPPETTDTTAMVENAVPDVPGQNDAGAAGAQADDDAAGEQSAPGEPRSPVERLAQSGDGDEPAEPAVDAAAAEPHDITPADRIAAFSGEEDAPAADVSAPNPDSDEADEGAADEAAMQELASVEPMRPERRPPGAERTEPGAPEPMSYWQLPQQWRSEMPEMKITVLVYAQAPEDRFLLMNGERLEEGDELEGGVVLEEIRREGAVFSYRSRQFMVKS